MKSGVIYAKTEAGRQEIQDRGHRLPASLRSILLMIDGQRDQSQLHELMSGLHAPDDALERLVVMGLAKRAEIQSHVAAEVPIASLGASITPVPSGDGYPKLYALLSETVAKDLGLKGYFVQLKIERCADLAALLALVSAASPELPDIRVCEQARLSRDARFDGLFFAAVKRPTGWRRATCVDVRQWQRMMR